MEDRFQALIGEHALGLLAPDEQEAVESHLAAGCSDCVAALRAHREALAALPLSLPPAATPPRTREQLLDLAHASSLGDLASYQGTEIVPGMRVALHRQDPARGLRAFVLRARPGAIHPRHRHHGDEIVLVLTGQLRDERGTYGPGQICHSREGEIHTAEAMPGAECIGYLLMYGDTESVG